MNITRPIGVNDGSTPRQKLGVLYWILDEIPSRKITAWECDFIEELSEHLEDIPADVIFGEARTAKIEELWMKFKEYY